MSSEFLQIEQIVGEVMVGAIFAYAAYWAFAVRRALASRDYRRQALWLVAVCLYWIAYLPDKGNSNSPYIQLAIAFYYLFLPVMLFAWIDATVRVARRSDPLLRNTLHWNTLRRLIWAAVALATISNVLLNSANISTGNTPSGILLLVAFVPPLAALISGPPVIVLSAIRSKDATFRRSLKWFGMFIVFLLISIVVSAFTSFIGMDTALGIIFGVIRDFTFASAAYSLYRSARSLAPINRLQAIEPVTISPTAFRTT